MKSLLSRWLLLSLRSPSVRAFLPYPVSLVACLIKECQALMVDRRGIEPRLSACKADVLAVITISPYYKTCFSLFTRVYHFRHRPIWWAELDSNQQCTGFSFLKAINQLLYMSFLILYIYNTKFFYIFQVMVGFITVFQNENRNKYFVIHKSFG